MTTLADLLASVFDRRKVPLESTFLGEKTLAELAFELVSSAGEASGLASAAAIMSGYSSLDDADKLTFFGMMAVEMNISPDKVRQTLEAYEAMPSKVTYRDFAAAAEPLRQELIRRLNRVPGATGGLVQMRADLLRFGKGDPDLEALDLDFRHLLASWFNRGFLVLRPISWESPAHVLEKIIAYEAVHTIDSWEDLRRRLEPADRRCFAFFHPAMPDEPLIFVEVALTRGMAQSIQSLLEEGREEKPAESSGLMVNYLYELGRVAQNHERFATSREISTSPQIRALCALAQKILQPEKTT
ncbi:MAG: malonyl-CoA decarboxylase family protein [Flavimaricola sp.]|nr:malonyl-CoA decarboxylase family protein [Flavimaricola sp.]